MNINITREDFERYCPSAVMPDDVVYNRISAYFDDGMRLAQRIVGPGVSDDVETLRLATRVAVLEAYNLAIPHLDLVLTENGFGVVSNQNVAPASRDRVLRLAQQVRDSRDDAVDDLIDALRGKEQWREHAIAIGAFASLVWNAKLAIPLFQRQATLSLKAYDLLDQAKNLRVVTTDNYYQETRNNTLGRYIMLTLTWRFGSFGGGNRGNRGGFRPGAGGPPMGGGFGGGRGGFGGGRRF